jgi:hypothetical protein
MEHDAAQKSGEEHVLSYASASAYDSYVPELLLAQLPAALGIGWVGLILLRIMDAGIYGVTFVIAFLASILGVVVSLLITRAVVPRSALNAARAAVLGLHILYLAAALVFVCRVVFTIATSKPSDHGPGGF